MPTVNGTLKFFGPTKDGLKATLSGDWDDEENPKKQWVTWEEAKPLRDARLVFKSQSETWEDGKPKWKTDGTPSISIIKTFNGKGVPPTCQVVLNGEAGNGATPPASEAPVSSVSWDEVERRYRTSMVIALRTWRNLLEGAVPDDATLAACTATVFIQASNMGLRGLVAEPKEEGGPVGGYDDKPEAMKDEEDDDLPF